MSVYISEWINKIKRNRWAWAFYAVISLSILVSLVCYSFASSVVKNNLNNSGLQSAMHARDNYDNYFNGILNSAFTVMQSNALQKFLGRREMTPEQRTAAAVELSGDIRVAMYNHPAVVRCTVIIRGMNVGVDAQGMSELELVYHAYFRDAFPSQQDWMDALFPEQQKIFHILSMDGLTKVYMFYVLPTTKDKCVAAIELNIDKINAMLASGDSESGANIFIAEKGGRVLFSNAEEITTGGMIDVMDVESKEGKNAGGEECLVSQVFSEKLDIVYQHVIPVKRQLQEMRLLRNSFIIGFLLCLLLCSFFVRRFSRAWQRYQRSIDENTARQAAYVRANTLSKVLKGDIVVDAPSESVLTECGLILDGKAFAVFIIGADDAEDIVEFEGERNTMGIALGNEISSVISSNIRNTTVHVCQINHEYAGVVSFLEDYPDRDGFTETIDALCVSLSRKTGKEFICAIGPFAESVSQLRTAYEQTQEIVNFRLTESGKNVYVYDDIISAPIWNMYSFNLENNLITAICSQDSGAAAAIIDSLLRFDDKLKQVNPGLVSVLVSEIVHTIMKIVAQTKKTEWSEYRKLYSLPAKIRDMNQLEEVKQQILAFVEKLCLENENHDEGSKSLKYKRIADYIEENYADSMLSVNEIADVFQMNRSWMSTNFKETFGVGVFEYIVNFRLKKAKELLETNKTLNQIAAETGFANPTAFRYAFKKNENMTPAQYRQMKLKNKDTKQE